MSVVQDSVVTPSKPVKPEKKTQSATRLFLSRLLQGCLGLVLTVIVATSVKRQLFHLFLNDGSALYDSIRDAIWTTETSLGIGLATLIVWAIGLFASSYFACRKPADIYPLILALSGLVIAGWMIPSLFIQGGIAGPTTAIRMLSIVPLIAWGAYTAKWRGLEAKTLEEKAND